MSKPEQAAKPVPQHIFDRHESEWRQMQVKEPAPKPVAIPSQA